MEILKRNPKRYQDPFFVYGWKFFSPLWGTNSKTTHELTLTFFSLLRLSITWTLKIQSSTNKCVFCYCQQTFDGSSQLLTTAECVVIKSNCWAQFRQHSQKLGGAVEHLIDGSEKHICRLSFEFYSPHAIERCSNTLKDTVEAPAMDLFRLKAIRGT